MDSAEIPNPSSATSQLQSSSAPPASHGAPPSRRLLRNGYVDLGEFARPRPRRRPRGRTRARGRALRRLRHVDGCITIGALQCRASSRPSHIQRGAPAGRGFGRRGAAAGRGFGRRGAAAGHRFGQCGAAAAAGLAGGTRQAAAPPLREEVSERPGCRIPAAASSI